MSQPTLGPVGAYPSTPAAVALNVSGNHLSLLYRVDEGWFELEISGHERFHSRTVEPARVVWVVPGHTSDALNQIVLLAELVAEQFAEGRMPYGFDPRGAAFAPDGTLLLGPALGLNCVSLILAIFDAAGLPLVALDTWEQAPPSRREEDAAELARIFDQLTWRGDAAWAARARAELARRPPHVRPCEAAAASGLSGHPVVFARAAPAGVVLLGRLARW